MTSIRAILTGLLLMRVERLMRTWLLLRSVCLILTRLVLRTVLLVRAMLLMLVRGWRAIGMHTGRGGR